MGRAGTGGADMCRAGTDADRTGTDEADAGEASVGGRTRKFPAPTLSPVVSRI